MTLPETPLSDPEMICTVSPWCTLVAMSTLQLREEAIEPPSVCAGDTTSESTHAMFSRSTRKRLRMVDAVLRSQAASYVPS